MMNIHIFHLIKQLKKWISLCCYVYNMKDMKKKCH